MSKRTSTKPSTAPAPLTISEQLKREAQAKAEAEAKQMRDEREARERQRIEAERRRAAEAEAEARAKAEAEARAEQHRIAAMNAAKAEHERDIREWEETYAVYSQLDDLLTKIQQTKDHADGAHLREVPWMFANEKAFRDFRDYVKIALSKSRDVLVTGNTKGK